MKKILLISICLFASCTTIHFDNGNESGEPKSQKWHHNFGLGLYEGSQPVNLENSCPDQDWSSVRTQVSFINSFAGSLVNFAGPIWYPKTVTVSCR